MNDKKSEDEFIEKFGMFFERYSSYPRIAGRMFGYLLICDPPYKTAKQLVNRLKIAKSSVSGMMRLLIQSRIVEEVSMAGERSRFYRIREGGWESLFLEKLHALSSVRQLLLEGGTLLKNKDPKLLNRIKELDDLYAFFENEMPLMTKRWNKYKIQRVKK